MGTNSTLDISGNLSGKSATFTSTVRSQISFTPLTTTQVNALTAVGQGDVVYNSTINSLQQYDGTMWQTLSSTTPSSGYESTGTANISIGSGTISLVNQRWIKIGNIVYINAHVRATSGATGAGNNIQLNILIPNSFTTVVSSGSGTCNILAGTNNLNLLNCLWNDSTHFHVTGNNGLLGFSGQTVDFYFDYSISV